MTGNNRREGSDPWHGRQPKYLRLIVKKPNRYALVTKLPSGELVECPLGRPRRRP